MTSTIYCYSTFLTVPPAPIFPTELHLKKMCSLVWCNIGDIALSTKDAFDSFRKLRKPSLDYTRLRAIQSMFDPLYPKGLQWETTMTG